MATQDQPLRAHRQGSTLVSMNDAASGLTDEKLIQQVSQGDRVAFETLYQRFESRVISFLAARARPPLNAEDIAQETWTRVFRQAKKYNPAEGKFISWLLTIANNRLIDEVRKRQRRPESSLESDSAQNVVCADALPNDPKLDALGNCLQEIESDFVQVIKLRLQGLSSREISKQLDIPVQTVDSRTSRGKARLKTCVEGKLK